MTLKLRSLVLPVLAASGPALFAQAPPPPPPSFGEVMEVNVVNIEVYVTDRDGKRVTGLRKEDFEVLEDGKPVGITNFSAVARPVPTVSGRAAPAAPQAVAAPPVSATPEATPTTGSTWWCWSTTSISGRRTARGRSSRSASSSPATSAPWTA